ncbi:MAG: HesB/IscA family protein [Alcanivorax sp.]
MTDSPIKITEKAAEHINTLMADAPDGTQGLRLTVKTTGCSGNSYKMEYVENGEKLDKDEQFEEKGASIFIPKLYSWMLFGTTIDYITDELGNERFDFINPNETGRCGCGESFHVGGGLPQKP